MDIKTFHYHKNSGWSVPIFPPLDSEKTVLFAFAAPEYRNNPAPLKELAAAYPHAKIIGCSSAGEIAGARIMDESISVAVARFNDTDTRLAITFIKDNQDSFRAGQAIAQQLNAPNLCHIFVVSDGLKINGTELVRGLNTVERKDVLITGGLAGDGSAFKNTWTIHQGEIKNDAVVAIGFYGNKLHVGHASKGGWDIFGVERRVTRSKDNILYELDNKPVLALYKDYLGDRAAELPASGLLFPLSIRKDEHDKRQLVRTILAIDEAAQSLIFAGDIPTGYLAQLMKANFDRLITGATEAGKIASSFLSTQKNVNSNGVLSIAVSCVGRRLLLGERTEEETESTLESLPSGSQQVGFYSYGELSPYANGTCDLHNQTMTLTTLYEE